MGAIFVYVLLAYVCFTALSRPAWGVIGFYAFLLLDPAWNWRWALPAGVTYQKYVFFSLFAGFFLSGFATSRQSFQGKLGITSMVAFTAWSYLSGTQSIDPASTQFFLSYFWKISLVTCLAILLLRNASHLRYLLASASIMQGYNAYQINLDYFQTGFSRYAYSKWGSYGVDNNGYSIITVPILAISLSLALTEKNKWTKALFFGITILQMHQIMLMASRGCMLAAVVAGAIAVFYMPRTRENLLTVLFASIAAVVLAGPFVINEFSSSFAQGEERDSSAESRFYLWKAGFRITADYPLLGVGPNAARRLVPLPQYYDGGLDQGTKALHNLFFDVSTGMGVPGLVLFLVFLLVPLRHCYKKRKLVDDELFLPYLAVMAGIPGYAVASMFSSGILFESGYILPITGFCCANIEMRRNSLATPMHEDEPDEILSPGEVVSLSHYAQDTAD